LYRRLSGADISDAVIEADRPGTGPDLAVSAGSRRRAGITGRRRVVRSDPAGLGALAGRLAETRSGDGGVGAGVRGQQPVLDGDIFDQLARQPRTAIPAERPGGFGRRARG